MIRECRFGPSGGLRLSPRCSAPVHAEQSARVELAHSYACRLPNSLVLRLELALVPADRGGRRRPVVDGYRASMSFGRRRRDAEPVVHDAVIVLEDRDAVAPGGRAIARAWVLTPDELPGFVDEGTVFTLLEGDRIVARAKVLALLDDPVPFPLHDLAAAKTRVLHAH